MQSLNTAPFEICNPLYHIFWAPVGTEFPLVYADPNPAVWTRIGTGGPLNYGEEGVTVDLPQSISDFRSVGSAAVRKSFRDTEDAKFRLVLIDMTIEQWYHAINRNPITSTPAAGAGTAAYKSVGGDRGLLVDTVALLLRANISPYVAEGKSQYKVWRAQQKGSPAKVSVRAQPVGIALEWGAIVDPDKAVGKQLWEYEAQSGSLLT